jgi:hypothetical protein
MTRSTTETSAPSYRGLLALVIILGVLILLALGALIAGLIVNAGRAGGAGAPYLATLLAPGEHIESTQLDGNRILVRLSGGAAGDELVVLDAASGRVIGRIAVNAAP